MSTLTLIRSDPESTGGTQYVQTHTGTGSSYFHFYMSPTLMGMSFADASSGAGVSASAGVSGLDVKPGLRWVITWDFNGVDKPRVEFEYSDSDTSPVWVSAGTYDLPVTVKRPTGLASTYLGHPSSVPAKGSVVSLSLDNDGVETYSFNPGRDHTSSDAYDSWTDSASSVVVSMFNASGTDYKARLVTANELQFTGAGDYTQWPVEATPTVQKDSGGYTVLQVFRIYEVTVDFLIMWASTSAYNDGLRVHAYPTGANVGKLLAQIDGAGSVGVSALTGAGHDDGELHCWVMRADGDNQTFSIQTDLSPINTAPIPQTMGAIAHTAPRTWTDGYIALNGQPGAVRLEKWWSTALTDDEMTNAITVAMAEAGA